MQKLYADIIVDITHEKVDRAFQYKVPENLAKRTKPGSLVTIPFGRGNRTISGYVIALKTEAEIDRDKLKEIISVSEDALSVESRMIVLAAWIRKQYGGTMIQALKTVMPFREEVKKKDIRTIHRLIGKEEAKEAALYYEEKHQSARARVLKGLTENEITAYETAIKAWKTTKKTLDELAEKGFLSIESRQEYRNPIEDMKLSQEMPAQNNSLDNGSTDNDSTGGDIHSSGVSSLNEEQKTACEGILHEWENEDRPSLLLGVTGSGKTLVYLTLMEKVLAENKQVILLIPEISLTYQNVKRFYARFGDKISVVHSRMTKAARYDQMERARKGDISILIGPRSALFAPFQNLGLIIIDEEHESSYNSEGTPRYRSTETAEFIAGESGAHLLLGSATPRVETYYKCKNGSYALFAIQNRYADAKLPDVSVVDMREELKHGNRSIISRRLYSLIKDRLEKKEQVMLFLNRRGFSGFISCRSCGYVAKCPHCDVSLTLHKNGRLVCHYCGFETANIKKCPDCGSEYIGGFKAGTQQIEKLVGSMFPAASVLRMDADTTKGKQGHEKILSRFANKEADILIGTQMIVKGHDFPGVTLMGVLAADLSLYVEDYHSAERTYQQIVQAVGRAGRDMVQGEAVIQTYSPKNYAIEAAVSQDYDAFYEEEIAYRSLLGYPPIKHMIAIRVQGHDEAFTENALKHIYKYALRCNKDDSISLIGPAKDSITKINDYYRMVLYLRADDEEHLIGMREHIEKYIEINEGFRHVLISFETL